MLSTVRLLFSQYRKHGIRSKQNRPTCNKQKCSVLQPRTTRAISRVPKVGEGSAVPTYSPEKIADRHGPERNTTSTQSRLLDVNKSTSCRKVPRILSQTPPCGNLVVCSPQKRDGHVGTPVHTTTGLSARGDLIPWCRLPRARQEVRIIQALSSHIQSRGYGTRLIQSFSTIPWKKPTVSHTIYCKLKSSLEMQAARRATCWAPFLHTSKTWLGSAT